MKHKHGLAVARFQPFHLGHKRMVDEMIENCERITLVVGSTQEHGTEKNPFTFMERKKMIKKAYDDDPDAWYKIKVLPVQDINDNVGWAKYILDTVEEHLCETKDHEIYVEPDAYYCGSEYDYSWFRQTNLEKVIIDRTNKDLPYVSATMIRNMAMYGDDRWKWCVPECNWSVVKKLQEKYELQRTR